MTLRVLWRAHAPLCLAVSCFGHCYVQGHPGTDPQDLHECAVLRCAGGAACMICHNGLGKPWGGGAGLRAAGAQALLSELAACACIGLAASADHVNAPLLWDKQARALFPSFPLPPLPWLLPRPRMRVHQPGCVGGPRQRAAALGQTGAPWFSATAFCRPLQRPRATAPGVGGRESPAAPASSIGCCVHTLAVQQPPGALAAQACLVLTPRRMPPRAYSGAG